MSGINVYSSKDLLNWKNEGKALSPINGTEIAPERVVERPKVVYNEPTKTWVVSFHLQLSSRRLTEGHLDVVSCGQQQLRASKARSRDKRECYRYEVEIIIHDSKLLNVQ